MSAENFMVLPNNAKAFEVISAFPTENAKFLAIYGEKGVGKTHLSYIHQNLKNAWRLTPEILENLSNFESVNYVLDDLENLNSKAQENLFHLFNHIQNFGGSLLVFSRLPVAKIELLADLKSRLLTAAQIEIESPLDAHLELFLVKHASDRQIDLEPAVVAYILKNANRNVAFMEKLVQGLDALSLEQKRKITVPLAKEVLQKLL